MEGEAGPQGRLPRSGFLKFRPSGTAFEPQDHQEFVWDESLPPGKLLSHRKDNYDDSTLGDCVPAARLRRSVRQRSGRRPHDRTNPRADLYSTPWNGKTTRDARVPSRPRAAPLGEGREAWLFSPPLG